MKVRPYETLYHEDHGATLKHKCGKRIVALSLLSFSLIFLFGPFLFFMASLFYFFRPESHPDLWGNQSLHHPFLTGTMHYRNQLLCHQPRRTAKARMADGKGLCRPPRTAKVDGNVRGGKGLHCRPLRTADGKGAFAISCRRQRILTAIIALLLR